MVAIDRDARRLERVVDTANRLRLAERVRVATSDGTSSLTPDSFDGVLIDAPCSNTGVLGARPAARWRFGPQSMRSLEEVQTRLLDGGATCVRPGGRLVWSTCSLEPEENERRVRTFLDGHPGWTHEEELVRLPDAENGPWDGGYAARLRRPS